jgi:glycosyltransferase involved in cell wall biosynthesis
MLLEIIASTEAHSPSITADRSDYQPYDHEWTVLVPFFNERSYLPHMLASLAGQNRPARIVLIDNGSTDDSAGIATAECRRHGLDHMLVREPRPGKVAALAAGLAQVRTPFVATCDADTWYPADYLDQGRRLLETSGSAAAGAWFASERTGKLRRFREALHIRLAARLLAGQCHTGGAGQVFRTASLRQAGGFDPARWKYVLEDHEIIHRVRKTGTIEYGAAFWCAPSARDRDRDSISWSFIEQLVYHATASRSGDWFFYRFLNTRLRARRLTSARMRERAFHGIGGRNFASREIEDWKLEGTTDAAPYIVCG